jgi:hypothetical protein
VYRRRRSGSFPGSHDATHPGAKLEPAARRAANVKTEAEHAALLEALDAEAEGDHD